MSWPDYTYREWQELNTPLTPEDKERIEREWETELNKKHNKTNMKIKDLISGREKLQKYDELKQWKDLFEQSNHKITQSQYSVCTMGISCGTSTFELPDNIRKIIVDALEAEIKKLDEE